MRPPNLGKCTSLIDMFAGQALASYLLSAVPNKLPANLPEGTTVGELLAKKSYDMAECMMAERAKRGVK